ncbi:hypothetical protein LP419_19360 [Massilia sp. H-1]|nr:hypothetical protein LP419_19360 [Massilia sp. H-1]
MPGHCRHGPRDDGGLGSDGLVPLASALGHHPDAQRCLRFDTVVVYQTNHMQLLSSADVAARLLAWL